MTTIIFHPNASKKEKLTEAGQTLKVEFTWLQKLDKNTFESQTPWMLCRDYFNEIWLKCWSKGNVNAKEVYGFKIDNLDFRGEGDTLFFLGMSYAKLDKFDLSTFETWLGTFNKIEEMNGFSSTQIVGRNSDGKFIVLACSRQWLDNPTLLNVLTLSLRLMWNLPEDKSFLSKHPFEFVLTQKECVNHVYNTDVFLFKNSIGIYGVKEKLLQVLSAIFYNFSMWSQMKSKHSHLTNDQLLNYNDWDPYILHNYSGIVAVCQRTFYNEVENEFGNKLKEQMKKNELRSAA